MSGHSKWSQIRHKKAVTDAKKGQLFSKLVREIMVAVRSGGPSPDTNIRLKTALERAKTQGLPKDNIERAIEHASGEGEAGKLQEFLYEATIPGGIAILIEGITDNRNRSLAELKHILSDHKGKPADPGSVAWNFDKIGTLEITESENSKSKDDMELAFIESGARDFSFFEGSWNVETEFAEREIVRHNLEKQFIAVKEAGHEYKPRTTIDISPAAQETIRSVLEALLDHDDVQDVYTNIS